MSEAKTETAKPNDEYIIVNLDEAYRRIWGYDNYRSEFVTPCVTQARIRRYAEN